MKNMIKKTMAKGGRLAGMVTDKTFTLLFILDNFLRHIFFFMVCSSSI